MKEFDVVALGELLIDFTEYGISEQNNKLLEVNPGGAPCNVLSMLSNLGKKTAFIGKVGNDGFGKMLKSRIEDVGINTSGLKMDDKVNTTLAFVHNYSDGDREFSFYRNPGADMMLLQDEIPKDLIKSARIFHFGTLSMTHDEVRNATKKAVKIAKENGLTITFDPNLRESLWSSLDLAKEQFDYGMKNCDVLKISDNEIVWFTGKEDFDEGIAILQEKYNIKLIVLSLGKDGSVAYYNNKKVKVDSFLMGNTVETTGAGDTFFACVINYILENGLSDLTENKLNEMLKFANAAAAIITTRKGALCVMPTKIETQNLLG